MSFAAIYVAEFPVVAWRRHAPVLNEQPCVVVDGIPPVEAVVSLCSRAGNAGIEHGMSRVQAEAGSTAIFRSRRIAEERTAFAILSETAKQFSPRIEAIATPDNRYATAQRMAAVLLIDSSGTETLFGSAESYARRLHRELRTAGFPAGVAAASNAEAALLLARSSQGVVCADRSNVRGRLARLPVALLPCEAGVLAVFHRWGIRTLGDLAALPETALVSRLGRAGHRLQQLARGEADHLLVPEADEFTLAATTVLDTSIDLLESLLFVLSPMLDTLLRKALERAYAIRSVRVTLCLDRGAPHAFEIRPATPTQSRELLLKLINLELQARSPRSGIVSVQLQAEPAQPQTAQRGLFQAQFPDPDRLELLLARLRSIAGEGNVGSPQLRNSHREDDFTIGPFQPSLYQEAAPARVPSRLALRSFRPPQPVRVACHDGQPRAVFWRGAKLAATAAAGPWHTSGSWWDGQAWDHDLWDVVIAEPVQALRLRQDHASRAWFVVGLYD